jgi:hypothetical protein
MGDHLPDGRTILNVLSFLSIQGEGMTFTGINHLAVFGAAVAAWLVGAAWYMALAKPWMSALGKSRDALMGPSGKPSPVPFVMSFLAERVMARVLAGFVITSMTVNHRFGGARPMPTVIDVGHWLAVLVIEGASSVPSLREALGPRDQSAISLRLPAASLFP